MTRIDGRQADEPRKVQIVPGYLNFAEGSALIDMGQTRVLCAVTVEEKVPPFLKGGGSGWLTAEYSMLPRSTLVRTARESATRKPSGRTMEIQRLIGRSLRAAIDLKALGEKTLTVDCDVIQADGGTRTAAITGSYVAVYQALLQMRRNNRIGSLPLGPAVSAISVGIVDKQLLLDLCYEEDFRAEADFNIVMTDKGELVEVQGTAEGSPFSRSLLDQVLDLSQKGCHYLFDAQKQAIKSL